MLGAFADCGWEGPLGVSGDVADGRGRDDERDDVALPGPRDDGLRVLIINGPLDDILLPGRPVEPCSHSSSGSATETRIGCRRAAKRVAGTSKDRCRRSRSRVRSCGSRRRSKGSHYHG